jgi:DNA polymerase III subunit gamma/tau
MSLDTKYRPIRYSDVVGNEGVVKVLKGIVSSGRGRSSSYIFAGLWGGGKTTLSRILARALVCDAPVGGEPCDECFNCKSALGGVSDAIVEFDAASKSTKGDIQGLLESLEYSSFSGKRRVYIIDEAHAIGSSAADALLKSLEENVIGSDSEKKMVCIFCTTEVEKIRGAIKSRCAPVFTIKPSTVGEIANRMEYICRMEGVTLVERRAIEIIAEMNEGHIRDCLKSLEGVIAMGGVTVDMVRKYLHMDRNDGVCDILLSSSGGEMISRVKEMLLTTPVSVLYEKLIDCSMVTFGLMNGVKIGVERWEEKKLREIGVKVGVEKLMGIVESLGSKSVKATGNMLICELYREIYGDKYREVERVKMVKKDMEEKKDEKMSITNYIMVVNNMLKE